MNEHKQCTIHIAEPSWKSQLGHFAATTLPICAAAIERGLDYRVWAHRTIKSINTNFDQKIEPIYSKDSYCYWGEGLREMAKNICYWRDGYFISAMYVWIDTRSQKAFIMELLRTLAASPLRWIRSNKSAEGVKKCLYPADTKHQICVHIQNKIPRCYHRPFTIRMAIRLASALQRIISVSTWSAVRNILLEFVYRMFGAVVYCAPYSQLRETIKAIKRYGVSRDDLIYWSTITEYNFLIVALLARYCARRKLHLAIVFHHPPRWSDSLVNWLGYKIYIDAIDRQALHLYTYASPLVSLHEDYWQRPVTRLPNPQLRQEKNNLRRVVPAYSVDNSIQVGFFGHTRLDKGYDHLLQMLRFLQELPSNEHFVFHIQVAETNNQIVEVLIRKMMDIGNQNIILYKGTLTVMEYESAQERLDVVILPYDPLPWQAQFSGTLFDAISLAKVVIVTEGTCLEKEMQEYGVGVSVPVERTPEQMVEALCYVKDHYEELASAAIEKAKIFRKQHGADNAVRVLLQNLQNSKSGDQ